MKSGVVIAITTFEHLCLFSFLNGFITLMKISEMTRDPRLLAVWGRGKE